MTTERPNPRHPDADTSAPAWWQIRPDELASRFEWDADALMDALDPEAFTDEQADLALDAIACCRGSLPALVVKIDADVHEVLRARFALFSDTPNGVLRRLLDLDDSRPSSPTGRRSPGRRRRARKGELLPLDRYRLPLLRALIEGGGSLPARDAVDAVGAALAADLASADQDQLQNGAPRWRDRVHHARLRLTAQGLIARDGPWGVWSITDEGRRSLVDGGPR